MTVELQASFGRAIEDEGLPAVVDHSADAVSRGRTRCRAPSSGAEGGGPPGTGGRSGRRRMGAGAKKDEQLGAEASS